MKILFGIIVAAFIGIIGFASTLPDTFYVERVLRMKASPQVVYAYIHDFNNWSAWSPWVVKDPSMEITVSDKSSGLGATYEWSGNAEVGVGRMEMINSQVDSSVRLKLIIFEPFAAENIANFSLEPVGEFTRVTWQVDGPMSFMSKVFSVFVSMDQMIGPDFEVGLKKLKALAEAANNAAAYATEKTYASTR